jgi:hypothetical protein
MARVRYLGIYPVKFPESIEIEGMQTVSEVMAPLIEKTGMPSDFFWNRHLVLLNGKRPEMDDAVSDGDNLQILSYSEGG